jgi:adenylyltransferase/sulfurtransferase
VAAFPPLVEPVAALSDAERARTARHSALAGLGPVGQRRLANARIGVVGAGGLGSSALLSLAAAGVGELVVIDDDTVDVSNLHRQIIHGIPDVGRSKLESARDSIAAVSPETRVTAHEVRLDESNALALLRGCDLVLDGSDTFATRTAVASACEALGIPLVWGTVQEFHAQLTVFWSAPPEGVEPVVLADLHDPAETGEPPTCAAVGVLGALCVQVGALMATEAVKLVVGAGEPLLGRVLLIDGLRARQREVLLRARFQGARARPRTGEDRPATAVLQL